MSALLKPIIIDLQQPVHFTVQVRNVERSEQFYSTVLGLEMAARPLKFPGRWYQVGAFQLHLIVSQDACRRPSEAKWERQPHIAFAIASLTSVKQALIEQAIEFQMSSSEGTALFVKDPDGNVIELMQVPPPESA